MDCRRCATCCIAPDITSLAKPVGEPCLHLDSYGSCSVYPTRPAVCRDYLADEICELIDAPTLDERIEKYMRLFSLHKQ